MSKHTEYGEVTTAFRTAIEDRATWFYLLLKAAEELGADPEKIAEKAITQFGQSKGKKLGEVKTPGEFVDALACGYAEKAFDMEKVEKNETKGVLRFHYCALVESWKKLGCSAEEISQLCRLARHGDYGVISNFPDLQLDFQKLIAEGDDVCELVITKKILNE